MSSVEFKGYTFKQRRSAVIHVLRIILTEIYDLGIPLFDGFDEYETFFNCFEKGEFPLTRLSAIERYYAIFIVSKNNNEILKSFHIAFRHYDDVMYTIHTRNTISFLANALGLVRNVNNEIALAMTKQMMLGYLQ